MNPRLLRNSILCLAFLLLIPAAARASADTTPPGIVSIAFAPTSVDVTSTSQIVSVTVSATDDSSGVEEIDCAFTNPSGNSGLYIYMDVYSDLVAGNPLNGVYCATQSLGTCSEAGAWTLQSVSVTDQCGNNTYYAANASGSTKAFPPGTQTTFTVTNSNPAPTPGPAPVVTSFSVSPTVVNLTGTTIVTGTATLTGSNIANSYFDFSSPSGYHDVGGAFYTGNPPLGTSGTYTTTFSFTSCDPPGTWTLSYLSAAGPSTSACGGVSATTYSTSNFSAVTSSTTITVQNPAADVTPPVLTGLVLSSTTLDVTNGDASLSGSVSATDNSSGVRSGYGEYTSTSGQSLELDFYNSTAGAGGTFQANIYATTCTLPGVYTLTSLTLYDDCENQASYGGSNQAFPAGVLPSSFLVTNGTLSTGSITVNLLPQSLDYQFPAPAWYLDSGSNNIEFAGSVVTGVAPGQHTINFTTTTGSAIAGYTTPAPQTLTIAANQNADVTGTYVSTTPGDSVEAILLPPAVTGAALWNVDYGPLQPSGTIISALADGTPLADGTHVVEFSGVTGYFAPASQMVTTGDNQTTLTSGTYAMITGSGSLTVTLAPQGAINAGAKWNVDGGASQSSGATVGNLLATTHTVKFLGGGTAFAPPANKQVLINANETTSITGTYIALSTGSGSLMVAISPASLAGSGWYLDMNSSATQKGGATLTGISEGGHTVNFTTATGYMTPASQNIIIVPDETVTTSGTYIKATPFAGAADSFVGISPNGNALLTLTLADSGKFTGKLISANGKPYSIKGAFDSTGYFSGEAGKPPAPYVLQITGSTASTYVLTGSVNGKELTAFPAAYAKGQTVTEEGKYTALLTGTDTDPGIPQGAGYATLTISKTGGGSATGKLADGTPFSASGILVAGTAGHQLIVYDPNIYSKKGLLSGILTFGVPAAGQFGGTLMWEKPAGRGDYYAAGFDTPLNVAGALYVFDAAKPVPFASGTLTLSAGALPETVAQPFTVNAKGDVTITSPNTDNVKLTIKGSTGAVTGSFQPTDPLTMKLLKAIPFSGLLLQAPDNPRAAGYFLSPEVSGTGYSGNVTLP